VLIVLGVYSTYLTKAGGCIGVVGHVEVEASQALVVVAAIVIGEETHDVHLLPLAVVEEAVCFHPRLYNLSM
jgi:hypothetical protein